MDQTDPKQPNRPDPPDPPGPPGQAGAPDAVRPSWFRQVTFHSLLAGLCPLIPIPFLDDRVLTGVRRKMVRDLAAERGLTGPLALDRERVDVLAGTRGESRGCLGWIGWIAFSLTLRLLAKLFRKILIIFAVKESVDTASRVFHEGYLLHLTFAWVPAWSSGGEAGPGAPEPGSGLDSGASSGSKSGRAGGLDAALDLDRAVAVRRTIEATLDAVDPRPLEQALRRTFRGSRRLLRRGARLLTRRGGGRRGLRGPRIETERALPEDEERRLLGRVLDRLVADLWEERGYLTALEESYRRALAAPPLPPAPPGEAGGEEDPGRLESADTPGEPGAAP